MEGLEGLEGLEGMEGMDDVPSPSKDAEMLLDSELKMMESPIVEK